MIYRLYDTYPYVYDRLPSIIIFNLSTYRKMKQLMYWKLMGMHAETSQAKFYNSIYVVNVVCAWILRLLNQVIVYSEIFCWSKVKY